MQTGFLEIVLKIKSILIQFEKLLGASSLLLLLALSMFQLIARNFFNLGFSHIDVVSKHLILFIIFMGAALVSEQNKHIKIDILSPFLSITQQQALIRPLLFISSAISGIFGWYAVIFWLDELEYAPSNEQWSVYLALILPIGFFILALHLFLLTLTGLDESVERNCQQVRSESDLKKAQQSNKSTSENQNCSDIN